MSTARFARLLRRPLSDDTGVALATVLIFMFAGVLLSLVVASTVLYSYSFSSSTKAGVQAQSAAEAGIAAARAELLRGTCVPAHSGLFEGTDPDYSVQVFQETAPGVWSKGCPTPSQRVRLEATGTATAKGVGGDSSGDVAVIEVILDANSSAPGIDGNGAAIFAYDASGFGGSGHLISNGYDADVMLRTGDVVCTGAADGAANLVVKSGNFTAGGSCQVTGSVWVNGDVTLSGNPTIGGSVIGNNVSGMGKIGGNVWADAAVTLNQSTVSNGKWVSGASVSITGGSTTGPVWARNGSAHIAGNVTGLVTANAGDVTVGNAGATLSGGIIASGTVRITGDTTEGGVHARGLRMEGGTLKGGAQIAGPGCYVGGVAVDVVIRSFATGCGPHTGWSIGTVADPAPPVSPVKPPAIDVPEWIDFGSNPEELTGAWWPGYEVYVVPTGTDCSQQDTVKNLLERFDTRPGLLDARGCKDFGASAWTTADFDLVGSTSITLKNDIVIIGHDIHIGGGAKITGAKAEGNAKVWLINPDRGAVANGKPDCNAGDRLSIDGGATFVNADFLMYTPCRFVLGSGISIRGQVFAGTAGIDGNAHLTFVPVGLPGYDLSTGLPTTPTGTEWDRVIVSQRNIVG